MTYSGLSRSCRQALSNALTINTRSHLLTPQYSLLAFDQPWHAEIAVESVYQHEIGLQNFITHDNSGPIAVLLIVLRDFLIQLKSTTAVTVTVVAICVAENVDIWAERGKVA
jgi:hypothetical protein